MANLNRIHFESFTPNLGDNRQLVTDRLELSLAVGMTKEELKAFARAVPESLDIPEKDAVAAAIEELKALPPETLVDSAAWLDPSRRLDEAVAAQGAAAMQKLALAWAPFVKFSGQHTLDGQPCTTLAEYLGFVFAQAGRFNFLEIQDEVRRLNSVEGTRALFSDAQSGRTTSTSTAAGGPGGSQTGGR